MSNYKVKDLHSSQYCISNYADASAKMPVTNNLWTQSMINNIVHFYCLVCSMSSYISLFWCLFFFGCKAQSKDVLCCPTQHMFYGYVIKHDLSKLLDTNLHFAVILLKVSQASNVKYLTCQKIVYISLFGFLKHSH